MRKRHGKVWGFTLIEMLVALAILGILTALVLPQVTSMMADQRTRAAASDLMGELAYARAEAVKLSGRVGLERSGADWQGGWVIFVDKNRNGVRDVDANPALNDDVLKVKTAVTPPIKVCVVGLPAVDVVEFGADGRFRTYAAGVQQTIASQVIRFSSDRASAQHRGRDLVIGPSGRVSLDSGANANQCP